jgi:hypothetical protein
VIAETLSCSKAGAVPRPTVGEQLVLPVDTALSSSELTSLAIAAAADGGGAPGACAGGIDSPPMIELCNEQRTQEW